MKSTSWLCWLLALSVIYQSEAQYKFRRPQLPPPPPPPLSPPQIFKKSWAPGPRIPPMGNSIHMAANFPHKRLMYKPPNYRFRRPPGPPPPPPPPPSAMFNVVPSSYKNPMPSVLGGMMNNNPSVGQRVPPIKELQSIAKVPQQYSPEYRPEATASLSTHRGGIDDDKGPIHTIPAPNLGPASKSYQQQQQFLNQDNKGEESGRRPYTVTQVDYTNIFNGQETSVTPQRILPSNPTPTNSVQHQYEVTESNEVNSIPPTYFTPDFESAQYGSSIVREQQANDVYLNHPSSSGSRSTQLVSSSVVDPSAVAAGASMQANLHSSMHVDTSASGGSNGGGAQLSQASDLHVGQPGAAGPPLSAAKLYELLNAFPHQLTEQFSLNQQPQIQQHLLQQQLSQILQQQQQQDNQNAAVKTTFSQPTLHSFNYDEQANKQKQQQNIFINQNYASGRVTADYSLAPETSEINQEIHADANEQQENNIEFENPVSHVRPTTYFTKIGDEQNVGSQFYTTLPNRDAAEKLAALAAAGNVNSQLIGQLRKQQQQEKQQQSQNEESMPSNHKEDYRGDDDVQNTERFAERQRQHEHRQKLLYRRQKFREEQARREEEKEKYEQLNKEEEKHPLRIFVPEDNMEKEKDAAVDYDYENDEAEASQENEPFSEDTEFGSRIVSKTRK